MVCLQDVEYACNNTVNRSTGENPSVLLFGVTQRGKTVDSLRETLEMNDAVDNTRTLVDIRTRADEHIKQVQKYNEKTYNRKRKPACKYEVGDKVMIRNFDNTAGVCSKLVPLFKGPVRSKQSSAKQ